MNPRAITGVGIASALGTGGMETLTRMGDPPAPGAVASFDASKYPAAALPIVEVPGFDPTQYLGDKGLRTLDRLTKLLVVAARLSLHAAGLKRDGDWKALGPERVGVCCSNAYGSLEAITELDRVALLEDARYINPAKFPNTVSNSASGYVSIWEDLRALNVSVSDGNCGALDAVGCADIFLATGRADAILTGGGEAMSEALYLAFERLGVLGPGARLGEGAAFLVLEPEAAARARSASILGLVTGYGTAFLAPAADVTLLFASAEAQIRAIRQALADAAIAPTDVDLVVSGLSGIDALDVEERAAIEAVLGKATIATPKLVFGETLGAGGALAMAVALAELGSARATNVLVTSIGYYGNASALVLRRS